MTLMLYIILGVAAGLKVILYVYCVALQKQSESMLALAEDHRNDIMSNVVAILTGAAASWWHKGWWIDPLGGILISLYIIYSWGAICKEQVRLQESHCIAIFLMTTKVGSKMSRIHEQPEVCSCFVGATG